MEQIEVTDEQLSHVPEVVKKWENRVLREDWEPKKAKEAMASAYEAAKLKVPEIVIASGPDHASRILAERGLELKDDELDEPCDGLGTTHWRSVYYFLREFCGLSIPEADPVVDLDLSGAHFWWTYDEVAVLCGPPKRKFLPRSTEEEQYVLHNDAGPALEWDDGLAAYIYRNTFIDWEWIEKRGEITADQVLNEKNAELRRVLFELYGKERIMRERGKKIQQDDYGKLWEVKVGSETRKMIQVINSTAEPDGTFKEYWLPVPPQMQSCREAIAWSFNIERAEDYQPQIQT